MPREDSFQPYVTVIARSPETVDSLTEYLHGAGVAAHGTRRIDSDGMIAPATSALVVFPDDFDTTEVLGRLTAIRRTRPHLLMVIITSAAARFLDTALPGDGTGALVVLPKPPFGWDILDAIRSHARRSGMRS
jgi:hypothetical protein